MQYFLPCSGHFGSVDFAFHRSCWMLDLSLKRAAEDRGFTPFAAFLHVDNAEHANWAKNGILAQILI